MNALSNGTVAETDRRAAHTAYMREYRKKNPQKHRDSSRRCRQRNPEKAKAKARAYYEAHRKVHDERTKKWWADHPGLLAESTRAYREKNREKINELARLRRVANPDRQRSQALKHKYGITLDERDALLKQQGFACAICRANDSGMSYDWHTDHDHVTGRVRGILCAHCNRMLGSARDSVAVLQAAIKYLGVEIAL